MVKSWTYSMNGQIGGKWLSDYKQVLSQGSSLVLASSESGEAGCWDEDRESLLVACRRMSMSLFLSLFLVYNKPVVAQSLAPKALKQESNEELKALLLQFLCQC